MTTRVSERLALRPKEAGELLDVSESTIYRWLRQPVDPLPAVRIYGVRRILRSDLERWLADQRRASVYEQTSVTAAPTTERVQ